MWIRKNRVYIEFRLPTYCVRCQFLVLDGGRHAPGREHADWVEGVSVVLGEHNVCR